MNKRISIQVKLVAVIVTLLILVCASISAIAFSAMSSQIYVAVMQKVQSDLATGQALIDSSYPGPWQVRDGVLYKGATKMNDNTAIVDQIGNLTNDTVTIFHQDTRITTNVMREGKRAVGTKISANVADAVLKQGQTYLGEAEVVGVKYQTGYTPLRDNDGKIIGIFYVGASKEFAEQLMQQFLLKFALVATVLLLVACGLVWYLGYRVAQPIILMEKTVEQVAQGNLRVADLPCGSNDEIGALCQSINLMTANLRQLVQQVSQSAAIVTQSSEELSANADESSQASERAVTAMIEVAADNDKQLHAVERTTLVVAEMSAGIQAAATNANSVAEVTDKTATAADSGSNAVNKAVQQMLLIEQKVGQSAQVVGKLSAHSAKIGAIVETIAAIAGQTNLLALNAAIEAARAGEQGRGFAVVAEEVRKLAEQSEDATKQIAALIGEVRSDTAEAVSAMQAGMTEVSVGATVVATAGQAFDDIHQLIGQVATEVREISGVTQELAASSQQIVDSIRDMGAITGGMARQTQSVSAAGQEQLASMEEVAAASQALSQMAQDLQNSVRRFEV